MRIRSTRTGCCLAAVGAIACLATGAAHATEVLLSTTTGATLGGLDFRDGDVAHYDDQAGTGTLFFDEDVFPTGQQVDGLHVFANGHLALSMGGIGTLGGVSFTDGDVLDYDPIALTATLLLDESLFLDDEDVDAFSILPNGSFLLSTVGVASLGGLAFSSGDLVAYDPLGGTASLFLSESVFGTSRNIDAVHAESDSVVILSTTNGGTIGGVTFTDGDLVRYDLVSDTASIVFSQSSFTSGLEDIDAVYVAPPGFVPEPGTGLLLAFGLALLPRRRRRPAQA